VTQPGGHVADEDLLVLGVLDVDLADLPRLAHLDEYGGVALHVSLLTLMTVVSEVCSRTASEPDRDRVTVSG
jgi:hypothetical protein